MRTVVVMLVMAGSAYAVPPITQAEALAYHASGACSMMEPGTGLRKDGQGWIVSPFPGPHRVIYGHSERVIDMDAGRAYRLAVTPPDAEVQWCVPGKIAGREPCGLVPQSLLWPAVTVR